MSPIKGVMRFGMKQTLSTRCVGPYQVMKRIGKISYELEFPKELVAMHAFFLYFTLQEECGSYRIHSSIRE